MKKMVYTIATFVISGSIVTSVFADQKITSKKSPTKIEMSSLKTSNNKKNMHATQVLDRTDLRVGFVDSYQVMGSCKEGEKARKEVEEKQKEYSAAIQQEEQKIQQAVAEYKGKANMLSEPAREKEEMRLMKMERDYKASLQDKEEELKLEMQIRTEKLAKNMDAGVKKMAKEQGLDVVFDRATGRAIYVVDSYDMTEKAVSVVDKEYTIKIAQEERAVQQINKTTVIAQK